MVVVYLHSSSCSISTNETKLSDRGRPGDHLGGGGWGRGEGRDEGGGGGGRERGGEEREREREREGEREGREKVSVYTE